jgi:hypothetical protein
MLEILSFRQQMRKDIAVEAEDDNCPITYGENNGWHTVGRAITTKRTDEAKGWANELSNY